GGDYQARNIQAVFQIFDVLKPEVSVSPENIADGIRKTVINTGLSGRWQVTGRDPLVICDTGHNREGLEYVVKQLMQTPGSERHIVLGFVNDKDLDPVLPLFPKNAHYYFTKASVPRALDENLLRDQAARYGLAGSAFPDVAAAVNAARSAAFRTDIIFIGGSTFVVADALKDL
ncbi:MAG: bifunctional folylpolyglutamate synthase/dihydrofolate synthase, partial [Bacteroidales bacterium]